MTFVYERGFDILCFLPGSRWTALFVFVLLFRRVDPLSPHPHLFKPPTQCQGLRPGTPRPRPNHRTPFHRPSGWAKKSVEPRRCVRDDFCRLRGFFVLRTSLWTPAYARLWGSRCYPLTNGEWTMDDDDEVEIEARYRRYPPLWSRSYAS